MKVIREKKKLIVLVVVVVLAVLIGVGVAVNATGSSGGMAKSVTFSEDMDGAYVYFRAVDAAGNVGEWSEPQRLWIDTASPIITAKQESVEVEEGKSNELETYFNIAENGSADITSITFIDKSNGNKVVENTSELAVGTHEIEATVEKANGAKATASVIIVIAVAGFTLTFIANGGTYSTITEAKTVVFPEQNPTLTDYKFTGWYYDEALTKKASVGDSLTQNINLYAGWSSYVLNPNNGETLIDIYWGYESNQSLGGKSGKYATENTDVVYIYEGSSEIEYIEVVPSMTSANYCYSEQDNGNILEEREDEEMFQYFYSEGNVLMLNTNNIMRRQAEVNFGETIVGLVGVKIHFVDGSIQEDYINFHLFVSWYCLVQGTQIMLGNRETKAIEDITYDDELLVWNFDEGKFDTAKPLWILKSQVTPEYYLVKFDDGSEIKIVLNHRIFVKERGEFVYPTADEVMTTFTAYGTETKVVSVELIKEKVDYYNLITDYHMNVFANGILTSCRLNNIYPIKDMKFQKDNRELTKLEEYPNIPEDYFRGLRIAEQPKDINRGNAVKHTADLEGYVQRLIKGAKEKEII